MSVYDLANSLDVSESTIENDLRHLSRLAAPHQVKITRTGTVIEVRGREEDQRQLMRRSIMDAENPATILATDQLEAAYPSYDVRDIKRHVVQALTANGLNCNDYTLNPLILDLVIATDRITDDHVLDPPATDHAAQQDPRLRRAARAVTAYLARAYGVSFGPAETDAVALLLASKTTLLRGATDHDVVADHVGPELVNLVREVLSRLDDTYLVDLTDDAFVTSLALHVHNMLLRARAGRPQPNPLAAVIRSSHPLVHELAVFFTSELERETGTQIHPDETGFIAFHLGSALDRRRRSGSAVSISVVSPGYHDLAQLVADRITTQVGERATVQQVVETVEPRAATLTGELVITPIPIPDLHPARQVLISPLLSQADLDLIDAQVRAQQRRNSWMRLTGQLHELFHDGLFFTSPNAANRDQVLELLCQALESHGAVPPGFLAQVQQREELSGTAFNDIVAIPHTLGMPAERTSIAVATFHAPVDWGGSPVRLVLLVAFSARDRNLFRDTFDQLVIALTEPGNVRRLIERGHRLSEFLTELSQLMQAE
ncbi:BglG family transcription antiterminator [Propionicimonas sp.]|uniref:BglG family transcription antiterminator n=1 Tax=Propionicimonas sp. TaxID=1955623 RepID=UPI003D0FE021